MSEPRKNNGLNASLSEDLTVILLRGNGSPRTFRFSLPALQRSLTALGFFFALAIAAAVFFFLLNLFHFTPDHTDSVSSSILPSLTSTPTAEGPKDDELRKEVAGLHEDVIRLNALANGRKDLANGSNGALIQFFGPRNTAVPESTLQVKNVKVRKDATKNIYVDFEIHNVDPDQKQVRGYIVVLAKTPNFLATYPAGAFSPTQNIVLDFTRGETFAVSRFRQARATFTNLPLEGKNAQYEVLLFANDGQVIADLHVEDQT